VSFASAKADARRESALEGRFQSVGAASAATTAGSRRERLQCGKPFPQK
jgi:hypothetical protein